MWACLFNSAKGRPSVTMRWWRSCTSRHPGHSAACAKSQGTRSLAGCWARMLVVRLVVIALYQCRGFSWLYGPDDEAPAGTRLPMVPWGHARPRRGRARDPAEPCGRVGSPTARSPRRDRRARPCWSVTWSASRHREARLSTLDWSICEPRPALCQPHLASLTQRKPT